MEGDDRIGTKPRPLVGGGLTSQVGTVDRRHNSKVERQRIAAWAETVLAGAKVPRLGEAS